MKKVFIHFASTGKILSFETSSSLKEDEMVLVETDQIIEEGKVIKKSGDSDSLEVGTGKILRKVIPEDYQWRCHLKKSARHFIDEARVKVQRHGLDMKILDAELSFDQKKLTFYFCAGGRIDFRSLVTDMAKSFDKLIRLQQIGARDEVKLFGGFGKCGRELCCTKFLNNLESITLEMAESQELACAGSGKLTGCCGKLMCCLSFEADNYKELKKKMPKMGTLYESSQGSGKVIGYNLLESKVILETKENKKIEVLV